MSQITANAARSLKLGCYCTLWDKDPACLEKKDVPPGYCGLCEKCGAPGHTRHFPGAVPYTGSWCERHYRRAMILHPLGQVGMLLYSLPFLVGMIFLILSRK